MTPAPTPESRIDAAAARLAQQYRAQGDLELMFIRQIASHAITRESVQRTINTLSHSGDPKDDARLDRFTRILARCERGISNSLRELKNLQDRREPDPLTAPVSRVTQTESRSAAPAIIGRNAQCPCGSGLKYKRCCANAGSRPAANGFSVR